MNLQIEVDNTKGLLVVEFVNNGLEPITLRDIYPPTEVIIENEFSERAEFYLSLPYGATVKTFTLEPGEKRRCEIDLASEFIYPRSGRYTAWIDYDSTIQTAKYAAPSSDAVRCQSNRVSFPIRM